MTSDHRGYSGQSKKRKILPEPQGPHGGTDLHFLSLQPDTSLHCKTHGYRASASRCVLAYAPAFAGIRCDYPRRDGQAELTWVAGYIQRWLTHLQMVTHPNTNLAWCWSTLLMWPTTLSTKPKRPAYSGEYSPIVSSWMTCSSAQLQAPNEPLTLTCITLSGAARSNTPSITHKPNDDDDISGHRV